MARSSRSLFAARSLSLLIIRSFPLLSCIACSPVRRFAWRAMPMSPRCNGGFSICLRLSLPIPSSFAPSRLARETLSIYTERPQPQKWCHAGARKRQALIPPLPTLRILSCFADAIRETQAIIAPKSSASRFKFSHYRAFYFSEHPRPSTLLNGIQLHSELQIDLVLVYRLTLRQTE